MRPIVYRASRGLLLCACAVCFAMACTMFRGSSRTLADDPSRLIGTWQLASFTTRLPDGRVIVPWGNQPPGRISYDRAGNVIALLMHELRDEATGLQSRPADVAEAYSAYFGTYEVDRARRVVTHHVTGSLNAERASGELERAYEFRGDDLVLTFTRGRGAAAVTNTLVWKRASGPDS